MRVSIEKGKYTFVQHKNGATEVLRYNEPWRDCVGDNLILCMAQEIERLRERIDAATNRLVCADIFCIDPNEAFRDTLNLLEDNK